MFRVTVRPTRSAVCYLSAISLVLVTLSVFEAVAQQPPPQRDATAIAAIQAAINGMGGQAAMATIQDCVLTGTSTPANGSPKNFAWTIAGTEFRIATSSGSGDNLFVSGHGSPAMVINGVVSTLNYHMARAQSPFYVPGYALSQQLSNSKLTFVYVGAITKNGVNAIQVHTSDDSDAIGTAVTTQEWYFDPVSFMPLWVEFRLPANDNAADYIDASLQFSQFQLVNGISVPYQIIYFEQSVKVSVSNVASTSFNSGVSPGVFDVPSGGQQ